ncbi:MAG: selenocysteine synthase [Candidatus Poribacteria bacterium]|nr:MAG: selenocysteine synthase [Candidatus Poribacteria bacterium]
MSVYDELGVRRVVNGFATLTRLGGSLMPQPVLTAMIEAASSYVDLEELQQRVGEAIAEMTQNEAAFVSCGAAAGIVLATAACLTDLDPERRRRLPQTDDFPRNEVIVFECHRIEHEFSIRQAGGKLRPVGRLEGVTPEELEAGITDRTAAVFVAPQGEGPPGLLPVPQIVEVAHRYGVPVIVDAAAQLPPPENLWRFTRDYGADVAIFSGGKGLCGPQTTGLILGRAEIIRACAFNACPHPYIGRPMKVGKEELAGIYAAVKWYLSLDHEALMASYEAMVQHFIEAFAGFEGVQVLRDFPSEAGQPMPRALLLLDEDRLGIRRDELLAALRSESPAIELAPAERPDGIYVNPQTLRPGEERLVSSRLMRIFLTRQLRAFQEEQRRDREP